MKQITPLSTSTLHDGNPPFRAILLKRFLPRNLTDVVGTRVPIGAISSAIYVLFICLPILALLIKVVQQDNPFGALTSEPALLALRLSLVTSAITIAIVLLVGTPFALFLARSRSPIMRVVDQLVELPIILPPVVAGVAMLLAFGRQGLLGPTLSGLGISLPFTTAAVIFAQIFVAAPFYVRSAKLGFQSIPRAYEENSLTLGLSPWQTFRKLTLPLAAPAMLTGVALAWARALSEFGATIMFAGNLTGKTQTMPLAIMAAMETSLDTAVAMSLMLLVLALLVLLCLGIITRNRWQAAA